MYDTILALMYSDSSITANDHVSKIRPSVTLSLIDDSQLCQWNKYDEMMI